MTLFKRTRAIIAAFLLWMSYRGGETPGAVTSVTLDVGHVDLHSLLAKLPDTTELLKEETIRPRGERYSAEVPDTLDLADHARLAINAMTHLRPEAAYALTQGFILSNPPK